MNNSKTKKGKNGFGMIRFFASGFNKSFGKFQQVKKLISHRSIAFNKLKHLIQILNQSYSPLLI